MPGTQPRGTHTVGPPLDSVSAVYTPVISPLITPDPGTSSSRGTPSVVSSFPPLPGTSSLSERSFFVPLSSSSSSGGTMPPSSSFLAPTFPQQCDVSMTSTHSLSDVGTSSSQFRKRKFDAGSVSGMQPPGSKRTSRSKTNDLNLVIILNALNSTLNRLADVMEKSLDSTAATTTTAPVTPSSIAVSFFESQTSWSSLAPSQSLVSGPSPVSPGEILDHAMRLTVDDGFLSEDELFVASLFFTSASEDAICAARTFVALDNNKVVQRHFFLSQLNTAALLPGRGKEMNNDNHSMMY